MKVRPENVLLDELRAKPEGLWPRVCGHILHEALGVRACDLIDIPAGTLRPEWEQLDEPRRRRQLVPNTPAIRNRCADLLLLEIESLNDALVRGGLKKLGKKALREKLDVIVPTLVSGPLSESLVRQNPFPRAWGAVGDEIARRVWARNTQDNREPEWLLAHGLLLSAFFASCQFTEARQVRIAFVAAFPGLLHLRGSFVRIPEQLSAEGIRDRPLPISQRHGGLTLRHAHLSPLLKATADEANAVAAGKGFAHLDAATEQRLKGVPWLRDPGRLTKLGVLPAVRRYDARLSRPGEHRTTDPRLGQSPWRSSSQTERTAGGVLQWLGRLPCSTELRDCLEDLYDSDRSNVRNRLMHGNLLEIESKKLETQMALIEPRRFGHMGQRTNTFLPANIAQLCLAALELLDKEVAELSSLTSRDLDWAAALALNPDEVSFGLRLRSDFQTLEDIGLVHGMNEYLRDVFPGLRMLFQVGMIGWAAHPFQPSLIRFMALGLVFETIYRLTVHLLGFTTIQVSRCRQTGHLRCQYKMLDNRPTGICTPEIQNRLLATVAVGRPLAERNLALAIKARNAFAHGAICSFDKRTVDATGHLFVKAMMTLMQAGMRHMVQECAYYRWQNIRQQAHGFDHEDWMTALDEIEELLRAAANRTD